MKIFKPSVGIAAVLVAFLAAAFGKSAAASGSTGNSGNNVRALLSNTLIPGENAIAGMGTVVEGDSTASDDSWLGQFNTAWSKYQSADKALTNAQSAIQQADQPVTPPPGTDITKLNAAVTKLDTNNKLLQQTVNDLRPVFGELKQVAEDPGTLDQIKKLQTDLKKAIKDFNSSPSAPSPPLPTTASGGGASGTKAGTQNGSQTGTQNGSQTGTQDSNGNSAVQKAISDANAGPYGSIGDMKSLISKLENPTAASGSSAAPANPDETINKDVQDALNAVQAAQVAQKGELKQLETNFKAAFSSLTQIP